MYNLFETAREFLVLNTASERTTLAFDAETFELPKGNEVFSPELSGKRRFYSGKDSNGIYIPGSLVLKDIYDDRGSPDVEVGSQVRGPFWDAGKCLVHCLGIDPKTNLQTDTAYTKKGVVLLPMNPSPELVNEARERGLKYWNKFEEEWASEIIEVEHLRATVARSQGLAPKTPGADYYKALAISQKKEREHKQKLAELGLVTDPLLEDPNKKDDELLAYAKKVARMVQDDKPEIDTLALVDKLMEDREFAKAFRTRYDLRKMPNTAPRKSQLDPKVEEAGA